MPFGLADIRRLHAEVQAPAEALRWESLVAAFANACEAQPAFQGFRGDIGTGVQLGMANADPPITRASMVAALLMELADQLNGHVEEADQIDPAGPPPYLQAIIDGPEHPIPPAPAPPAPPVAPVVAQADLVDLGRANGMRTPESTRHGRAMLQAARQLIGAFSWQPSDTTPSDWFSARGNQRRKAGKLYQPMSAVPHPDTGEWAANDFQVLLAQGGNLPWNAHLNCWEFVFVCAIRAGVLSVHDVRTMHMQAQIAARGGLAPSTGPGQVPPGHDLGAFGRYRTTMARQLRAQEAVRLGTAPGSPLMPSAGDLIFIEGGGSRIGHVCISEGRVWDAGHGRFHHTAVSLGHAGGNQVGRVDVRSGALGGMDRFFRPCPF